MRKNTQVFVIADYGKEDPAFIEVHQRITAFVPGADVQAVPVAPFNTAQTGFWAYQLALNAIEIKENHPQLAPRTYIFLNTAPRRDDLSPRRDNEGEKLIYAKLKGGVGVVGVFSGESFSFLKPLIEEAREIEVSGNGSQFRSRDVFPQILGEIARGDFSSLRKPVGIDSIPDALLGKIAHVDGYGNIKLSTRSSDLDGLRAGDTVRIRIGEVKATATYTDGIFHVCEGELCFAPGSSGPKGDRFLEVSKRLGNAWKELGEPEVGSRLRIEKISTRVRV